MDEDIKIPIYLITGFLESGKTSFIKSTISADYFQIDETTLIISCEKGLIEYEQTELLKYNTLIEYISTPENFNINVLKKLQFKYNPQRIILEYNPLWSVKKLYEMKLPRCWGIVQHIVTVDSKTYKIYLSNMKSLFVEMSTNADMVAFNRCNKDMPMAAFRRSIKVVNGQSEVIFEDENNNPIDIMDDGVAYDTTQDNIIIDDIDFGIFYIDIRDNPQRYENKNIEFKGCILKNKDKKVKTFLIGRRAMTCCADDIRFIGFVSEFKDIDSLKTGEWININGKINWEYSEVYNGNGPIIKINNISKSVPPDTELVYFN